MSLPSITEQSARDMQMPRQEAAMLCCEAYGRANAERLTREIEEILDTPEDEGD